MTDYADLVRAARERAEKATPGPWVVGAIGGQAYGLTDQRGFELRDDGLQEANRDFIAHARTDIPALCDAVEELEREAAEKPVDGWRKLRAADTRIAELEAENERLEQSECLAGDSCDFCSLLAEK